MIVASVLRNDRQVQRMAWLELGPGVESEGGQQRPGVEAELVLGPGVEQWKVGLEEGVLVR